MKFSEVVKNADNSDAALTTAKSAVAQAQAADATAHSSVVAALHGAVANQVAIVQPDGSVEVYSLDTAGTDYTVATIPGDFDIP
jgi:hypothetical protein